MRLHARERDDGNGRVVFLMGGEGERVESYRGWSRMRFGKNGAKAIINKPNNREEQIHNMN